MSNIMKFLGGLRACKESDWEGIRCQSDRIERSAAEREATERLGFAPRWHSFIEHGPHAGSWSMSVVLGTVSGSRTAEAVAVEHRRIEMAGGSVFGSRLTTINHSNAR